MTVHPLSRWLTVCLVGRHAIASTLIQDMRSIFHLASLHMCSRRMEVRMEATDGGPHLPCRRRLSDRVGGGTSRIRGAWNERGSSVDSHAQARGILQHRNTPGPDGLSPAQIVFGHPVWTR